MQIQRRIVPEMGSVITPRGQHKQIKFYGGDVAFLPRLEDAIGWIFQATAGQVSDHHGRRQRRQRRYRLEHA